MIYRNIYTRIWSDQKFNSLSEKAKFLFVYLLTNHHTSSIPGIYRAGSRCMAEELLWSDEEFLYTFEEVFQQGLAKADFESRVVYIPNAIKYNKPQSPNVIRSWSVHWNDLPDCELKLEAFESIRSCIETLSNPYVQAFDEEIIKPSPKALPKPSLKGSLKAFGKPSPKALAKTMPNQEQEQEQEQEQDKKNKQKKISIDESISESFARFREIYPGSVLGTKCKKIWAKKKLYLIADKILDDILERKSMHGCWQDGFVHAAHNYLENEMWNTPITPRKIYERAKKQQPVDPIINELFGEKQSDFEHRIHAGQTFDQN